MLQHSRSKFSNWGIGSVVVEFFPGVFFNPLCITKIKEGRGGGSLPRRRSREEHVTTPRERLRGKLEGGGSERVRPWPNGVAGYRKLKTCGNLRLRLATAWWLAITFIELKFAHKQTQVFNRLATQRKSTQVGFSSVSLSTIRVRVQGCTEMAFLLLALNLRVLASPFGHPSQVCVRKVTFCNLRWLATPFVQNFGEVD